MPVLAGGPSPQERTHDFELRARERGFLRVAQGSAKSHSHSDRAGASISIVFDQNRESVIDRIPVAAWIRPGDPKRGVRVYLEGDGRGFIRRYQRSVNPTPIRSIAFELAEIDPHPGVVVYLGRPCQYAPTGAAGCDPSLWSVARFGEIALDAMNARLTEVLTQAAPRGPITLIGYSGGGVMASLLAAERSDIARFVTLAAPLDVDAWTYLKGVPPLTASRSPLEFAHQLSSVPQIHFASPADQIVPPLILESYQKSLGSGASSTLVTEPGIRHAEWPKIWLRLLRRLEPS